MYRWDVGLAKTERAGGAGEAQEGAQGARRDGEEASEAGEQKQGQGRRGGGEDRKGTSRPRPMTHDGDGCDEEVIASAHFSEIDCGLYHRPWPRNRL